jgi:pyruvate/2-oxoglutarate dehydrogenase complex dihydrolipoamide acyltransferase (E2) component
MKKIPFTKIRGSIAEYVRFATSPSRPFFTTEINAHALEEYRARHEGITYTPLLMKIIASAVRKYPLMNAVRARGFFKNTFVVPDAVDMCFAMEKTYQGETFVAIPIIRSVNAKSIASIASEIAMLSGLPYEKMPGIDMVFKFHGLPYCLKYACLRLICRSPRHIQDFFGTVGFSNLGRFGVQIASPTWINNVTFVIGSIVEKAGVVNGGIERAPFLHVTMSFDHAIFDGAEAGRMLSEVRELIEKGNYEAL